ncbi:MAG: TIM barrel protein [Clostridia bacterium]|nr:TIM barrel protein [Clostridia bacterium]
MRYSVCASAVYMGTPLADAVRRISALSFSAFEFWSWWDQDMDAVARAIKDTGIAPIGMCTRFVPLNLPERREEYILGLRQSIDAAKKIGCGMLITQVGQALPNVERSAQHECIVEGLRACAPILESEGLTLVVEPLNTQIDHAGYYLDRSQEGFEMIGEVDSPAIRLLFDVYHQQITEGNLIQNITRNIGQIGHIHIAGNPGRHEPYLRSEVCYPTILEALAEEGYRGDVGLEYFPSMQPDESLRKLLQVMPL